MDRAILIMLLPFAICLFLVGLAFYLTYRGKAFKFNLSGFGIKISVTSASQRPTQLSHKDKHEQ